MSSEVELERLVVRLVGDLEGLESAYEEATEMVENLSTEQQRYEEVLDKVEASHEDLGVAVEDTTKAIDEYGLTVSDIDESTQAFTFSLDMLTEAEETLSTEAQNAAEALHKEQEAAQDANKSVDDFGKTHKDAGEKLREAKDKLDQFLGGLVAMPGPARRAATAIMGASNTVTMFLARTGPLLPILTALAIGLAGTLGPFLALNKVVKDSIQEMDRLDRTIKRATALGDSTANLQALSFALGEIAGMQPMRTEMALQRLQMRIGAAMEAGSSASKVFTDLGIDLDKLKEMTPTEQFKEVAKALGDVENDSKRARIAMQMFGREGLNIVGALKADAEAIDEAEAAARRLGITLTQTQSRGIEGANDAMGRLAKVSEGWAMQIAGELAPLVETVSEELIKWLLPAGQMAPLIQAAVDVMIDFVGYTIDAAAAVAGLGQVMTGQWKAGFQTMQAALSGNTAGVLRDLVDQRREAARLAGMEKEKAEEAAELDAERLAKLQALNTSAEEYVTSLESQLEFMRQANEEGGEQSQKIFELRRQGVDDALLQDAARFEAEIAKIQDRQTAEKEKQLQIEKEAAAQRLEALKQADQIRAKAEQGAAQGKALMKSLLTEEEQAFMRVQDLQEMLLEGHIDESAFDAAIEKINEELTGVTNHARRFWDALNGTDDSFGRGREGLKEAAKEFRAVQLQALSAKDLETRRQGGDMLPGRAMTLNEARTRVGEESRRVDPTQQKLVDVLTLLEERLAEPPNPDRPRFDLIDRLQD